METLMLRIIYIDVIKLNMYIYTNMRWFWFVFVCYEPPPLIIFILQLHFFAVHKTTDESKKHTNKLCKNDINGNDRRTQKCIKPFYLWKWTFKYISQQYCCMHETTRYKCKQMRIVSQTDTAARIE